jgi:hypothetical protein
MNSLITSVIIYLFYKLNVSIHLIFNVCNFLNEWIVFIFHSLCFTKSVGYASVCSLQSAGEAQSGPAGYQTDTRHSRAGLWDTGAGSCLRRTVPSHAETTEQLHMSPSGDKPTRLHSIISNTAQRQISYSPHLYFLHLIIQVRKTLKTNMSFNSGASSCLCYKESY